MVIIMTGTPYSPDHCSDDHFDDIDDDFDNIDDDNGPDDEMSMVIILDMEFE